MENAAETEYAVVDASFVACILALILSAGMLPMAVQQPLANPPQVVPSNGVTSLTLTAVEQPNNRASMVYNGSLMLPTIRVWPGDHLRVTYVNDLPAHTTEMCAIGICKDVTNLHFHGMEVSPDFPQDDVLTMLARPGQTLSYDVHVPANHMPGLFWIHTHPDHESAEQDLDGMSLAVIVDGIDRYAPQVRGLRERVMVIRTIDASPDEAARLRNVVETPSTNCRGAVKPVHYFPTINGTVRPSIAIAPGERQFWRIVNTQSEWYVDLTLDGAKFQVVAMDGQPLAYMRPSQPIVTMSHVFLAPASRVEAIVTGPPAGIHAKLRTLCVNTGPEGGDNPAAVLADIVPQTPTGPMQTVPVSAAPPVYHHVNVAAAEQSKPQFVATFTEGNHRFYINRQLFSMTSPPMATVDVGSVVHWRIVNNSHEMHPFHIHQIHFLTYMVNGVRVPDPVWLDTMNVEPGGTIDVVLDATQGVIRGMSVFHCHILTHEDKGMMAKVLFK